MDSDSDTTLVINGPGRALVLRRRRRQRRPNPALRFNNPMTGTYDIWVGTYSSGMSQPASLNISELYSQ